MDVASGALAAVEDADVVRDVVNGLRELPRILAEHAPRPKEEKLSLVFLRTRFASTAAAKFTAARRIDATPSGHRLQQSCLCRADQSCRWHSGPQ